MPEGGKIALLALLATLMLQFISGYLGVAGVLSNLLLPFPVCYLVLRNGSFWAGLVMAIATAGLTLAGGFDSGLAYLLQFGASGYLLGVLLRRGIAWDRSVFFTGLLLLLIGIAVGLIVATGNDTSLSSMIEQYLDGETETALAIATQGDFTPQQLAELQGGIKQMVDFMRQTFFAWVAAICFAMLLLQVGLAALFARGHYQLPGVDFARWKAPELLIWPLIGAGFCSLLLDSAGQQIAISLLILLVPVYFLQGLAVVSHYFARKGVPLIWRTLCYLLLTLLNPMPLIITGVGVFDLWADFRKPRLKKS